MAETQIATHHETAVTATNKVLRNTYMLLSMTLLFSAFMAGVSIMMNAPYLGILSLVGFIGLFFAVHKTQNSVWGLFWTFALTGFMGFTIGPIINMYMQTANGGGIVMQAMGLTGLIFFSLSGYVLVTKKDFSFMRNFLMAGLVMLAPLENDFANGYYPNLVREIAFNTVAQSALLWAAVRIRARLLLWSPHGG